MKRRLIVWRTVLGILQTTHRRHFHGRPFGPDLDLIFIAGAVIATKLEDKVANATKIAAYLEFPRETVRRKLNELVEMGILANGDGEYRPGPNLSSETLNKIADLIIKAAKELEASEPPPAQIEQEQTPRWRKGLPTIDWGLLILCSPDFYEIFILGTFELGFF